MRKFLNRFLIVCLVVLSSAFVFVACNNSTDDSDGSGTGNSTETVTGNNGSSGSGESNSAQTEGKTYNVSYMLNGGENHKDNPTTFTEDTETITLKAPTRVGYEFLGWYTDGLQGVYEENKVESLTKDTKKDLVLNAKWRGLWYSNGSAVVGFTDYAKTLETIDILPEITDSFGHYSRTDFSFYLWEGESTLIFHEGIESVDINLNSGARVNKLVLPSTITEVTHPSYLFCREVHVSSVEKWYDISVADPKIPTYNNIGWKLIVNGGWYKDLEIPNGTIEISDKRFYNGNFESVTIPDSVTTIVEGALEGLIGVEKVYIGSGLKSAKNWNIHYNSGLTPADLYVKDLVSLNNLLAMSDLGMYCGVLGGKIFVDGEQLTTLHINNNIAAYIANIKGIEDIIIKDGVTSISSLPQFSSDLILPTSLTTFTMLNSSNARLSTTKKYYYKGTRDEFIAKDFPVYRDIDIYYYSENEPTSTFGKYWKFASDGETPQEWPKTYTTNISEIVPDSTGYEYDSPNLLTIYNGEKYIYAYYSLNTLGDYKLYIVENGDTYIHVGDFSCGAYRINLKENIEGYTNENGEWIYGTEAGNSIVLAIGEN